MPAEEKSTKHCAGSCSVNSDVLAQHPQYGILGNTSSWQRIGQMFASTIVVVFFFFFIQPHHLPAMHIILTSFIHVLLITSCKMHDYRDEAGLVSGYKQLKILWFSDPCSAIFFFFFSLNKLQLGVSFKSFRKHTFFEELFMICRTQHWMLGEDNVRLVKWNQCQKFWSMTTLAAVQASLSVRSKYWSEQLKLKCQHPVQHPTLTLM